jgi:signal-transduction protein with cAMP-binding, CBS, and nucleotidyltransferase domain
MGEKNEASQGVWKKPLAMGFDRSGESAGNLIQNSGLSSAGILDERGNMKATAKSMTGTIVNDLLRSSYFRGAPGKVLKELAALFRQVSFSKGAIILKEKSQARHLLVLSKGAVALSSRQGEGEFITGIVKKKGDLFGWSALVSPHKYTSTAKALEDCQVLMIKGKDMERLFQRHPTFGLLFLQRFSCLIATRLFRTRSLLAETVS